MSRKKDGKKSYSIKGFYYWLVGPRTRVNYWTCSKLSAWIRDKAGVTHKPHAATAEEWRDFHRNNKGSVGYWVAEEGLDILQDIWMFIPDVIHRVRIYIRNRYIDKPHYLDTKLPRGEWYEFDTRVVHGMFEALVTFVEDEKASMLRWQSDEKYTLPNAAKGIEYLEWEMTLDQEKPDDPDWYPMVEQAARARETLEIYKWWKDVRPLRKEPGEVVGLWEFFDKEREKQIEEEGDDVGADGMWSILSRNYSDEDEAERKRLMDASNVEEMRQYDEDTAMLIKLVKMRESLWT